MMEEGGGGIQKVNNYTAVLHRPPDLAEAESSRAVRDITPRSNQVLSLRPLVLGRKYIQLRLNPGDLFNRLK
jgi:hypothetical protein